MPGLNYISTIRLNGNLHLRDKLTSKKKEKEVLYTFFFLF